MSAVIIYKISHNAFASCEVPEEFVRGMKRDLRLLGVPAVAVIRPKLAHSYRDA